MKGLGRNLTEFEETEQNRRMVERRKKNMAREQRKVKSIRGTSHMVYLEKGMRDVTERGKEAESLILWSFKDWWSLLLKKEHWQKSDEKYEQTCKGASESPQHWEVKWPSNRAQEWIVIESWITTGWIHAPYLEQIVISEGKGLDRFNNK